MSGKRPAITAKMRLKVFQDYGAIVCCQGRNCDSAIYLFEAELDHHLALINGGEHTTDNLRPLCRRCHARKSAREHRDNSRTKRIAKAQEVHKAVLARVMERPAGKIKSKGFEGWRKFNGDVVKRERV